MAGSSSLQVSGHVVHITKGKRRFYTERPAIEPPWPVNSIWVREVPERDRVIIAEAEIRTDINIGDPRLSALRKSRYLLENVGSAITDSTLRELLVSRVIDIIADYGEPEGVPLLNKARSLFGHNKEIRERISSALARIGANEDS